MDEFILSRIQFAANISFHILFPAITIALAWLLLYFKFRYSRSGDYKWMELYFTFTKVFALSFSLGVVSGVTMSFQFGTNWPGFMNTVGNIAGPLLAYEIITAFFLEATFLGIMLFAFRKVPAWVHTGSTALVAIGTTLSAFWILALNSWMHTPQGFEWIDGVVHATSWREIIFTPSMPYRLFHTLLSSGLTAGFLVGGILAWRRLRGDTRPAVDAGLRTAVALIVVLAPLQAVVGDLHGVNTRDYQPAKLAAMEALWDSKEGAPLVLFALPDVESRTNRFEVAIPKLGSLIVTREPNGFVQGLNDFEDRHPPVAVVFWSFRIMVFIGLIMIAFGIWGIYLRVRKRPWPAAFLRTFVWLTFSGWVATLAGWYVTEIGRQPWLVHDVLHTADAVADVPPAHVALTLAAYLVTYIFLLVAFVFTLYYMQRKEMENPPLEGGVSV